jgi:hypothetical protein
VINSSPERFREFMQKRRAERGRQRS